MNQQMSRLRPALVCVDDDEQLLETLEFLLTKHFPTYSVVACPGGVDAREQLRALKEQGQEVQLVLSDQMMPEVTGIELLRGVPASYPDAVRVVLTGQAGLQSAIDAIKEGIDDYLEKPLSEMELVKTIRTHLNNYLLRQENRRLQDFLKQSRRRTSEITDIAFRSFNDQLTRLLTGHGDRADLMNAIRKSRENISLLSLLHRIDHAIDQGEAYAPLDPAGLAGEILKGLVEPGGRSRLERRRQQVEVVNYEQGPSLVSNRAAVRIALEKVLENASNHSPRDSTLAITIRGPRFLRSQARQANELMPDLNDLLTRHFFVISIEDEGTPSEDDISALRACQVDNHTGFQGDGLKGLGLVIAQEYLMLLGGKLLIDAVAGRKGTALHVAIPHRTIPAAALA